MASAQPSTEIRIASIEDVPAIVEMAAKFLCVTPFGRWIEIEPSGLYEGVCNVLKAGGVCFVAERGGSIYGCLLGLVSGPWFAPERRVATELGWWVDPAHQGGMAGIRMLRAFESWAEDQGCVATILSDLPAMSQERIIGRTGYTLVERSWIKGVV